MAKHFVQINSENIVVRGFSDDFEQPTNGDICICEDGGRHFEINGVINPPLLDKNGVQIYKIAGGIIVTRDPEEIISDISSTMHQPTIEERTSAIESALLELILGGSV